MSQLHFAQLSDTHIRKDYSVGIIERHVHFIIISG